MVRFVEDDRYGMWQAGDIASEMGRESDDPEAPDIYLFEMALTMQVLALFDPYTLGLVERVP